MKLKQSLQRYIEMKAVYKTAKDLITILNQKTVCIIQVSNQGVNIHFIKSFQFINHCSAETQN